MTTTQKIVICNISDCLNPLSQQFQTLDQRHSANGPDKIGVLT